MRIGQALVGAWVSRCVLFAVEDSAATDPLVPFRVVHDAVAFNHAVGFPINDTVNAVVEVPFVDLFGAPGAEDGLVWVTVILTSSSECENIG